MGWGGVREGWCTCAIALILFADCAHCSVSVGVCIVLGGASCVAAACCSVLRWWVQPGDAGCCRDDVGCCSAVCIIIGV